jgi:hypothetical protein
VAAVRNSAMTSPMAARGYDGGASPVAHDSEDMFWDYGGDADTAGSKSGGGSGGVQSSKISKGSGKTLNKTEANLFAKWCRKEDLAAHLKYFCAFP